MPRHSTRVPMRWGDMDAYGHINNTAHLSYLEQARVDVFFTEASGRGLEGLATGIVVAEHSIRYRRPIRYAPLPLRIELWVTVIKSASYGVAYEIWDDSGADPVLTTTASSLLVPFDLAAERLRRLTPPEREFLATCQDG